LPGWFRGVGGRGGASVPARRRETVLLGFPSGVVPGGPGVPERGFRTGEAGSLCCGWRDEA
jgi:hypothetical protein